MFQKLATSWGDSMGSVLANAVLAIVECEAGGTFLDLRRFLLDEEFRKQILATVTDEEVRFFWEQSFRHVGTRSIGPILTRLDAFLRTKSVRRIVGATKSTFDWERVLNGEHILLCKLSLGLLGEENASLLGSLLVSQLHQAALRRQHIAREERHPAFVYLDEFQHFTTPSMAALLSEGRKYGVGLVLAHQTLSQMGGGSIEHAVLGNAYGRLVFRVGEGDAAKLASGFSFFEARDLISLERGQAIARLGSAERDFNLATLPPPTLVDENIAARVAAIRSASQRQFGQVLESNVAGVTAVEVAEELTPEEGVSESPVEPVEASNPAAYLPVAVPKSRRRGEEHRRLAQVIARLGQERGFLATLEEPVSHGRVDVSLRQGDITVACEISVSTEVRHELGNARKCLAVGFQHVVLIATDPSKRDRIEQTAARDEELQGVRVLDLESLALFLDTLLPSEPPPDKLVLGYKVRVKRQSQSPEEVAKRRDTIGKIVTRPNYPKE